MEERGRTRGSAPRREHGRRHWEVGYFADGEEVALVSSTRTAAKSPSRGPATRSPGRWRAATPAPSATSSTRPTSSCRSARSSCSASSTGAAGARRQPRPLVLLGFGVSHFFFNRGESASRCRSSIRCCSTCSAAASGSGSAVAARGCARLAGRLDAGRRALPDGLPGRAQRRRLRRHRRRLRRASSAPTGSPTANRSTTTSPTTSPRATPTARSTTTPTSPSSGSCPGREAGTTCRPRTRRGLLRPATFAFLILLGLRIRPGPAGRRLAAILAFGWAAYPYTAFALESNSNDTLVAMLLVARCWCSPGPARGAMAALATFAKFAPALLGADAAHLRGPRAPDEGARRARYSFSGAPHRRARAPFPRRLRLVAVSAMLWPAIDPGLQTVLRTHDRVPGRPRLAVQHLGPGALAGTAARRPARRDRGLSLLARLPSRGASP